MGIEYFSFFVSWEVCQSDTEKTEEEGWTVIESRRSRQCQRQASGEWGDQRDHHEEHQGKMHLIHNTFYNRCDISHLLPPM